MNSKNEWIIYICHYEAVVTSATAAVATEIDAATIYVSGMCITSLDDLYLWSERSMPMNGSEKRQMAKLRSDQLFTKII